MALGTIVIPTFSGHVRQATQLVSSIRSGNGASVDIMLVVSKDDEAFFEDTAKQHDCRLVFIETLIKDYIGKDIRASLLLKAVGKFRYQALKKLLGVCAAQTDFAFIADSESRIVADLSPMFLAGLNETTVLYSLRDWETLGRCLTTEVRDEVNFLLGARSQLWFFESFNWLYSTDLTRSMMRLLSDTHGKEWIFRAKPLFECQLYFQYAFAKNQPYRFLPVEELLAAHFGKTKSNAILERHASSIYRDHGIVEYLGHIISKEEYIEFISSPLIFRHLRVVRHEPAIIHNVVDRTRSKLANYEYLGEAAMHRGDFVRSDIAVLISGIFHNSEDVFNVHRQLQGTECDVFVGVNKSNPMIGLIQDVLKPKAIIEINDASRLGVRSYRLAQAARSEKNIKPNRDLGVVGMFDKLAGAYQAMLDEERSRGGSYGIVVRLRPDILSESRLRDAFWRVAEYSSTMEQSVFMPDRFWGQGVNDQFFFGLRSEMESLLSGLDGLAYAAADYLSPEHWLAQRMLRAKLKPVAFEYQYILTRGNYPSLPEVSARFHDQERLFWSRTNWFQPYVDQSVLVERSSLSAMIKNADLRTQTSFVRGREMEYFFVQIRGRLGVVVSEYKSPALFLTILPLWLRFTIPFMGQLGLPGMRLPGNRIWLGSLTGPDVVEIVSKNGDRTAAQVIDSRPNFAYRAAAHGLSAPRRIARRWRSRGRQLLIKSVRAIGAARRAIG